MKNCLFKRIFSVITCAVLLIGFMGIAVNAQTSLDPNRLGSITVTLKDTSGNTISGGEITMYQAAYMSSDGTTMIYTDSFADCAADINNLTSNTLADELCEFVSNRNITGDTRFSDDSGRICFDGLRTGVYLFVQENASEGYEIMLPFVVILPLFDTEYIYDIDAEPKMDSIAIIPTVTPTPVPQDTATPTPETGIATSVPSNTPSTNPRLPQTGQLNWPIPVLVISGLFLIIVGGIMIRAKED